MFSIKKNKKIICIFSHPDDVELVCYGTLKKFKKLKYNIHCLFLSKGEKSLASIEISRDDQTLKALSKISKNIYFEEFKDGQFYYNSEIITVIDKYLNKIKPSIVITHFTNSDGSSAHQDHHVTRLAASNSARRNNYVKILAYAEPEYNIKDFIPNLYVDITHYFKEKLKILNFHSNEKKKYYFKKKYLETKSYWCSQQINGSERLSKKKFYETFQVIFHNT